MLPSLTASKLVSVVLTVPHVALQVSTYKIVTVNATRQMSDLSPPYSSQQSRLTSYPENSATAEHAQPNEELHSPDHQGKDEMQTWMLLEVSHEFLNSLLAE